MHNEIFACALFSIGIIRVGRPQLKFMLGVCEKYTRSYYQPLPNMIEYEYVHMVMLENITIFSPATAAEIKRVKDRVPIYI